MQLERFGGTGSGAEPKRKSNLVHFILTIWHFILTIWHLLAAFY